jgi:exopolysaccharide biosynthesis WecB/TagA/CpsF family protein
VAQSEAHGEDGTASIDRGKWNVLGVRIDAVDYRAAVERIIVAARARRPLAVSALAVHGVMTGAIDPIHRYRLNQFDLLVPDGQPVRWALNWLHRTRLRERVYGPTLMLQVCQRAAEEQLPIFLFGSTAQVLAGLRDSLVKQVPRLRIAGIQPSQFRRLSPAERDSLVAGIRASGAAITFVGLGCPRQEVWAFELRQALSMPVVAVGAAFDFHAGTLPQAPHALQDRGLEWLFRLLTEPRRLWKRYLVLNPLYLSLLLLQLTGWYTVDPDQGPPPREDIRYG